jgi:hypothetical protein
VQENVTVTESVDVSPWQSDTVNSREMEAEFVDPFVAESESNSKSGDSAVESSSVP